VTAPEADADRARMNAERLAAATGDPVPGAAMPDPANRRFGV